MYEQKRPSYSYQLDFVVLKNTFKFWDTKREGKEIKNCGKFWLNWMNGFKILESSIKVIFNIS